MVCKHPRSPISLYFLRLNSGHLGIGKFLIAFQTGISFILTGLRNIALPVYRTGKTVSCLLSRILLSSLVLHNLILAVCDICRLQTGRLYIVLPIRIYTIYPIPIRSASLANRSSSLANPSASLQVCSLHLSHTVILAGFFAKSSCWWLPPFLQISFIRGKEGLTR